MADTRAIADWLIDGARSAPRPDFVLEQLCDRLVAAGIPLSRVAVFVRTLHPDIIGRRFIWQPGTPVVVSSGSFDLYDKDEFVNSPMVAVFRNKQPIRRRVADPDCPDDFSWLAEIRAQGATDYLASPLFFMDDSVHVVTWSTMQPGGFSDVQLAGLEAVVPPFARVAEIWALRRTASNLLDFYVGNQAGERILAGRIRRGHTEAINAAIWLSDMRGFTAHAERLPPQTLVDLLNQYFDCQVPAIVENGGEVLKFMGDGLLAIFPISADQADAADVCGRALVAAREARELAIGLGRSGGIDGVDGMSLGLGLHVGEVLYGNIGSGNRLDFTCIGPAVNLAARLEQLAGKLKRTILASPEFARHCAADLHHVGKFNLAGFSAEQTVFGITEEGEAGPAG
jgi:adenylate cyclase